MGSPLFGPDSRPSPQKGIVPDRAPTGQPLGVVSRPLGYRMIDLLEIENFRGFEHLELKNFKRINILVGDNGTGKTTFLEALFLATGRGPEQGVSFRPLRGLEMSPTVDHTELYRTIWADLFYKYDSNRHIKVDLRDLEEMVARSMFSTTESNKSLYH